MYIMSETWLALKLYMSEASEGILKIEETIKRIKQLPKDLIFLYIFSD